MCYNLSTCTCAERASKSQPLLPNKRSKLDGFCESECSLHCTNPHQQRPSNALPLNHRVEIPPMFNICVRIRGLDDPHKHPHQHRPANAFPLRHSVDPLSQSCVSESLGSTIPTNTHISEGQQVLSLCVNQLSLCVIMCQSA